LTEDGDVVTGDKDSAVLVPTLKTFGHRHSMDKLKQTGQNPGT
jgi:hypothetical protein